MKAAVRILTVLLALTLFLYPSVLPAADKAGDPPAADARGGSAAKGEPKSGEAKAAAAPKEDTPAEAVRAAAPRPLLPALSPAWPDYDPEYPSPVLMPATTGTLGLFTVETGETLPRTGYTLSTYVNKFSRMPGSVSVLGLGWTASYGLTDWVTVYVNFEPHRHIHVGGGRQGQLSFNTPTTNPQFGTTIYRQVAPGRAGYVEDFPFAGHNGGGVGEVTPGIQIGLASERRGSPFNLSIRTDFIIPTVTQLPGLIDNGTQTGQFNLLISGAVSKTWGGAMVTALNGGYRVTRDPRSGDDIAMQQAHQFRIGAGLLFFPERRVQVIAESSGILYLGNSTPNATRGARTPVDGVWGVRLYPWNNVAVDAGYRYMLNLRDHGDRHGFIVKLGMTHWGTKPPPPNRSPSATCSAERDMVYLGSGDVVGVSVSASDPDGDPLTYSWTATGGTVEGTGTAVRWNSSGAQQGSYTVSARVDDGRGGTASCAVDIRVEPRPNRAPSLTCSADRSSVLVGERVRITGTASDPDGDTLTFTWRTNAGQIVGTGNSVQLDTAGAQPGTATVTGRVDDGRGLAADCTVSINVQEPPPPPQASKISECFFNLNSARVDNVCKRVLDDVALRLQNDPTARVAIVGVADPGERRASTLATQRAQNSKDYLVQEKGIAETRIDVRSAGGQAGAGQQNRRVDIIWVPEGATY